MRETLTQGLPALGVDLKYIEQLENFSTMLMEKNKVMNLTGITEPREVATLHLLDSLALLPLAPLSGKTIVDVGTGAGFPGMPIAIACPDVQVTLMDAQQKRLTFLQAVIDELNVTNVTLIHRRAEDGAKDAQLREKFDVAVARAVAPLAVLAEYLLPFVKVGGKALCWKGPALQDELTQGRRAAFLLGGQVGEPVPCEFPGREWQHQLLPIQKVAKTARQYPRKAGTPSKLPLGQSAKNAEV